MPRYAAPWHLRFVPGNKNFMSHTGHCHVQGNKN